jgi:hypothetical protein
MVGTLCRTKKSLKKRKKKDDLMAKVTTPT